jgi:hypothetical protein
VNGDLSREQFLELTPSEYLKDGYRDSSGQLRPDLLSNYATAAATQLEMSATSPQEVAATLEALRQALPWHVGSPQELFLGAAQEALEIVAEMHETPSNPGLVSWIQQCARAVHDPEDIEAFLAHLEAVARQYGVMVALRSE